ncbi:hypothetical protein K469DRAFT_322002 [Zopfia rhizophila CBS 207.26]|uniref:BTB domain-containing protein n=1 Tax=Zopfia rhizophila CBS 207.26 TaxID=1314779 RepID=A0A6A6DLH0_9PEZI|nr:hypothetical protein K469DRAFT_322002 [Zopfia rhizophila CBS 207.26]
MPHIFTKSKPSNRKYEPLAFIQAGRDQYYMTPQSSEALNSALSNLNLSSSPTSSKPSSSTSTPNPKPPTRRPPSPPPGSSSLSKYPTRPPPSPSSLQWSERRVTPYLQLIVGRKVEGSRYITQRVFQIPSQLLTRSPVLTKYKRWALPLRENARLPVVELPELDPSAFKAYLEWICTGKINLPHNVYERRGDGSERGTKEWNMCWGLINAHILATTIQDSRFAEYMLRLLRGVLDEMEGPDEATIRHVFEMEDVGEGLKNLVVERCMFSGCLRGLKIEKLVEFPREFLARVVDRLVGGDGGEKEVCACYADGCDKHGKGNGKGKEKDFNEIREMKNEIKRTAVSNEQRRAIEVGLANGVKIIDWWGSREPSTPSLGDEESPIVEMPQAAMGAKLKVIFNGPVNSVPEEEEVKQETKEIVNEILKDTYEMEDEDRKIVVSEDPLETYLQIWAKLERKGDTKREVQITTEGDAKKAKGVNGKAYARQATASEDSLTTYPIICAEHVQSTSRDRAQVVVRGPTNTAAKAGENTDAKQEMEVTVEGDLIEATEVNNEAKTSEDINSKVILEELETHEDEGTVCTSLPRRDSGLGPQCPGAYPLED